MDFGDSHPWRLRLDSVEIGPEMVARTQTELSPGDIRGDDADVFGDAPNVRKDLDSGPGVRALHRRLVEWMYKSIVATFSPQ